MSIKEAVLHLINSSGFKIYAFANPPKGTRYQSFKNRFLRGSLSKDECVKMLKSFDYSIEKSFTVKAPVSGKIKIYRVE